MKLKEVFLIVSIPFTVIYIYHSGSARLLLLPHKREPKKIVSLVKKGRDLYPRTELLSIDISLRDENRSRYFKERQSARYAKISEQVFTVHEPGIGTILERSLISSRFRNLKLLQRIAFFMDARAPS